MLSKIIGVGNKIELSRVASKTDGDENAKKVYVSQVFDIVDEDRLKIAIPMDSGKIVLMPNNTRIDACFYTSKGLYQGRFIIVDRFKEGNLMIQVIELINELQKYQRRQYFRLSCTMGIMYRLYSDEELDNKEETSNILDIIYDDDENLCQAVALDISGGGMRFVCKERNNKGDLLLCLLSFDYGEEKKKFGIDAKVISVETVKNNSKLFCHRVEFCNVESSVREYIIKYIFDEERKRRKKENGQ